MKTFLRVSGFFLVATILIASALAASAAAPAWKAYDAWEVVKFTNEHGKVLELLCRVSECGPRQKSGEATLYPYKAVSLAQIGITTYYASHPSKYILDLKSRKVWVRGTKLVFNAKTELLGYGYTTVAAPPAEEVKSPPTTKPRTPEAKATPAESAKTSPASATLKPAAHRRRHRRRQQRDHTVAQESSPETESTPLPQPSARKAANAPLSSAELAWLKPDEKANYIKETSLKKTNSGRTDLQMATRALVAKNLREDARNRYESLINSGKFSDVDAFLSNIKHYSGTEVELSADEINALATLKTSGKYATAKLGYEAELAPVLGPDRHPLFSAHVRAHEIVQKYRALVPVKLPDAELAEIRKHSEKDFNDYNSIWLADVNNSDARNALNKKYHVEYLALAAQSKGSQAKTSGEKPFDESSIKTLSDLKKLAADDQKKFCTDHRQSGAGTTSNTECGDILALASPDRAYKECSERYHIPKERMDCMQKVKACQSSAGQANPSTQNSSPLPEDMRGYCAALLAETPTNNSGGNKPSLTDAKGVPNPAAKASAEDKENSPDQPQNKHLLGNILNGATIGAIGAFVGSFFGGPIVMLGVAVVAGVGGFIFSKYLSDKK